MKSSKISSYRFLFGPVRSRRLGTSLGVDLLPHKTCTLNCIYCECGKTTRKTLTRKEYLPTAEIIAELQSYLSDMPALDYITFSGAGEPTLHSGIQRLVDYLKQNHPHYPLALLTNGTLFTEPEVRKAIAGVDVVIASLDAATPEVFKALNRPHAGLSLDRIIEGLIDFRKTFSHRFLIEIFIVPGINDGEDELKAIRSVLEKIRPDGVHLNTLDRPGTESWVRPAESEELKRIAAALGHVDLVYFASRRRPKSIHRELSDEELLDTLRRRPFTVEDMASIFEMDPVQARKRLENLVTDGRIEKKQMQRGLFFQTKLNEKQESS